VTADSGNVTEDSEYRLRIGHVKTEWPVTFRRNDRSRSAGMTGHDQTEWLVTLVRNTQLFRYCSSSIKVGLLCAVDQPFTTVPPYSRLPTL
jgi:hypothetical protein